MRKTLDRALTVALFFVGVVWLWALVGRTGWASAQSVNDAGPGYEGVIRPFFDVAASTFVAVTALNAIQKSWIWFSVTILGRPPSHAGRVPAGRLRSGRSQDAADR